MMNYKFDSMNLSDNSYLIPSLANRINSYIIEIRVYYTNNEYIDASRYNVYEIKEKAYKSFISYMLWKDEFFNNTFFHYHCSTITKEQIENNLITLFNDNKEL